MFLNFKPISLKHFSFTNFSLNSFHISLFEHISHFIQTHHENYINKKMPKRIILIRHGESEGNVNPQSYSKIPDNKLQLTQKGIKQALTAGVKLQKIIKNESVKFIVSPYLRTIQTYENISKSIKQNLQHKAIEPLIREQEFGNLHFLSKDIIKERLFVGRFYYRLSNGENGADCYLRVSYFLDNLRKQMANKQNHFNNYVIISHGIIMRLILMKLMNLSIEQYEKLALPNNCAIWVMEKDMKGNYKLNKKIKYYY